MNKTNSNRAICMIGTLIPTEWFQELQAKSRIKSAPSPIFLQKMIYQALHDADEDVTCYSYPPVSSFPGTPRIGFGLRRKLLDHELPIITLPVLNIPLLKQVTVFFSFLFSILWWELRNIGKDKYILAYADFLEYTCPALLVSIFFKSKTILYLTEMPGIEHFHTGKVTLKKRLLFLSERLKLRVHQWFDGYIFISKELADAVNIKKRPFAVVEGFPDTDLYNSIPIQEKENVPTLMYAGSLREVYNIKLLVDAFQLVHGNCALWIYGNGCLKDYIQEAAKKDSRIQYRGIASHEEILKQEKKATLLAHIKDTTDPFVQYTFSSKLMEYFSSGTPVLTSHCGGVPEEYFDHCYVVEDLTKEKLAREIERVLSLNARELNDMGASAKAFLLTNTNEHVQGSKIRSLMDQMK